MRRFWSTSKRHRAFTLVELTIYTALLTLLLGSLYMLLRSAMYYFRTGEAYQSVQQQSILGLRLMSQELANSEPTNVVFDAPPPADHIIFLSADNPDQTAPWTYDGAGRLEFKKWVCFYHDGATDTLHRSEQTLALAQAIPPNPAPPTLADMKALPSETIARNLSSVQFDPNLDRVSIIVTGEQATASDKAARVDFRSQVRLENQQ